MKLITKVAALLAVVRREDLSEIAPVERVRIANLCRYIASLADPPQEIHKRSGVLLELSKYKREE